MAITKYFKIQGAVTGRGIEAFKDVEEKDMEAFCNIAKANNRGEEFKYSEISGKEYNRLIQVYHLR